MNDLGQISAAALQQYLAHGEDRGLDIAAAMATAGLSRDTLQQPDARIDGEDFEALLHQLIQQADDPLFGLRTSAFIQPGSYNVIGYIAMSVGTLHEALDKVTLYEKLAGDMGTTDIALTPEQAQIRWNCRYTRQPARQHLIDNVLSSWLCYARWLTGNDQLAPHQVWLEHSAPDNTSRAAYEDIFRCEVCFNKPVSALVGPAQLLELPIRQPDPLLLSTLESHAIAQLDKLGVETGLARRVRQCIHDAIGRTLPRKENIAERLGMNVRTLHRHLADEGHSWQKLLDEVRLQEARLQLRQTRKPQADIAEALGYSDIRSFQRSFKRHTGMTPGQYRQQDEPN